MITKAATSLSVDAPTPPVAVTIVVLSIMTSPVLSDSRTCTARPMVLILSGRTTGTPKARGRRSASRKTMGDFVPTAPAAWLLRLGIAPGI